MFDLSSLLTLLLLFICTCTYLKGRISWISNNKKGTLGVFYKAARVGERLSPYVSACCLIMAAYVLFFK